ncbi:hypothetical protein H7F15_09820 [Pontibacter sp. Tf4]|uniref:hypothetical protein n=1 Tax=Pontibacter sp. Tf4 TaxID=2761620 RepID=UPI001628A581|nr:hypothetical protein [Pontibacter sp. Tf4]MBB6611334.1 hypothetical protein [Pontibacter sp. Tf4]
MEFSPPIAARKTDELVRIANYPDKWNPVAVEQAKQELLKRNVPTDYQQRKVRNWNRFYKRKEQAISFRKAKESYSWVEVIFNLPAFLISVLFDWNLKKDGYTYKHKQRKYILAITGLLIVIVYVWVQLSQRSAI